MGLSVADATKAWRIRFRRGDERFVGFFLVVFAVAVFLVVDLVEELEVA